MGANQSRTDQAVLRVPADPMSVYNAFIDRDAISQWLPPAGSTAEIHEFQPSVGGRLRMTLHFDGHTEATGKSTSNTDVVNARFVSLEPGKQIRWAVEFQSDDPRFSGTMTMSWELTAVQGETQIVVIAENVPAGIDPEDHRNGLRSSLANLSAFVTRLRAVQRRSAT